jgi:methylmalonyl-CoA/ethylmalonyl-CoA epimerase
MFKKLDHIAIVVRDTEKSLTLYRDTMSLPVLFSEELAGPGVRLTHLDMGNVQLQLVQPLKTPHPLHDFLDTHGESLHHLCWQVDNIEESMAQLANHNLASRPNEPYDAPNGRRAAFIEPTQTNGILFEMTGD